RTMNSSIPEPVEKLVLSMLAKTPGERPQSMGQISSAFEELRRTLPEAQGGAGLEALVPPRSSPEPEMGPLPDPRTTSRAEVRPAPRPAARPGSAGALTTPAPSANATPVFTPGGTVDARSAGGMDRPSSSVTTLRSGAGAMEDEEAFAPPGWSRNKKLAVG